MRINVRLFAMIRDAAGVSEIALDIPASATAGEALQAIIVIHPSIRPYKQRLALAVNLEYVSADHSLADGDELALIPPVSGG